MRTNPFLRLRLGLAVRYAAVFALILLALGAITYTVMARQLLAGTDDLNRLAVGLLQGALVNKGGRLVIRQAQFQDLADEIRDIYGVALIQVYNQDARLVSRSRIGTGPVPPNGPQIETALLRGREIRLRREPLTWNEVTLGTLIVGRPLGEAQATLRELLAILAGSAALGVAAALAAGAWLAGNAVRPVRDAFEQQRRFIADASHELRTPVAVVQAQAETALETLPPDQPGLAEALGAIGRTIRQMGRLVEDLLLLSRSDAAMLGLDRHDFYLNELAEELIADYRPLAQQKGILLQLEGEGRDLRLHGDPAQVRRLLANLLDNAIKYTDPPGQVRVALDPESRPGWAVVRVADAGPGIPAEDLVHVFDRFYRAAGAREGAGLGLAIARAIAAAHGGDIRVSSPPGQGSLFEVALPLRVP